MFDPLIPTLFPTGTPAPQSDRSAANDAPTMDNTGEQYSIFENDFPIVMDLLANDTDPDGDDFWITRIDVGKALGTFTILPDKKSVEFDPTPQPATIFSQDYNHLFKGQKVYESITYYVEDEHGATNRAHAQVEITGINDPITVNALNPTITIQENAPGASTIEFVGNAFQPVGSTNPVFWINEPDVELTTVSIVPHAGSENAGVFQGTNFSPIAGPQGSVMTGQGILHTTSPYLYTVDFVPNINVSGTFTYDIIFSDVDVSVTKELTIDILPEETPPANTPPRGLTDLYATLEDKPLNISSLDGVLKTDTDDDVADIPNLHVTHVNGVSIANGTLQSNKGNAVVMQADGSFTYDPGLTFAGLRGGDYAQDGFSYTLSDGKDSTEVPVIIMIVGTDKDARQEVGSSEGTVFFSDDQGPKLMAGLIGDDQFFLNSLEDSVTGGGGADTIVFARIDPGELPDGAQLRIDLDHHELQDSDGNSYGTLFGIDHAIGTTSHDILRGTEGDNWLIGLEGKDLFIATGGADILLGGAGRDILTFREWEPEEVQTEVRLPYDIDLPEPELLGGIFFNPNVPGSGTGLAADLSIDSIEILQGSRAGDILVAQDGRFGNWARGADGLDGKFGNWGEVVEDGLDGKFGNWGLVTGDDLDGKFGNWGLVASYGLDGKFGNWGRTTLNGLNGDDFLFASAYMQTHFLGGGGRDTVSYALLDGGMHVELDGALTKSGKEKGRGLGGQAEGDSFVGVENLVGTQGDDQIGGNGRNNVLVGEDGDDFIFGKAGKDWLEGGIGNDILDGGIGRDTAIYAGDVADYVMTKLDRTTVMVASVTEGVDILHNIEMVMFANGHEVEIALL